MHLSTVHIWNDVRIYYRECRSLAARGFDVTLAAVDGDASAPGKVRIVKLPRFKGRLFRIMLGPIFALIKVLQLKPHLVHFHDPELVPLALLLRLLGIKVVYDIHENLREGLREKTWIPLKSVLLPIFFYLESLALRRFRVVIAEQSYMALYRASAADITVVFNYPDAEHLAAYRNSHRTRDSIRLFYIGLVSADRGIITTLKAIERLRSKGVDVTFDCVGRLDDGLGTDAEFQRLRGALDSIARFHGRLDLDEGYAISRGATVGLSVLEATKNYVGSYPTKIFEYMAVGLPFITSDFPLYREAVRLAGSGVCIDPTDPEALANAILDLHANGAEYEQMATNGIAAVGSVFSWNREVDKLEAIYNELARSVPAPGLTSN